MTVTGYNLFLPALLGCASTSTPSSTSGAGFSLKRCFKCNRSLAFPECFFRSKNHTSGYANHCKQCERARKPRKIKPETVDDGAKKCARCDSRKPIAEMAKGNAGVCKRCAAIQQREWREKNREHYDAWREGYQDKTRHINTAKKAEWRAQNPERHRASQNAWRSKKMAEDVSFRMGCYLRNRMNGAIKRQLSGAKQTIKNLGCHTDDLVAFLESQFEEGMTWESWSLHGWHIDHIKPLECFDLTDAEQLKEASHFRNLRPLWAKENIGQSDNFDEARRALYAERLRLYPKEKPNQ